MIYICTVLYMITSFLLMYNITTIVSLVTNTNIKFNISLYLFLYIVCSVVYFFCYASYGYMFLDFILLLLYYVLLFFCIYRNHTFYKPSKIIYICALYLSLDSILNSILQFIFSTFYERYDTWSTKLIVSIISNVTMLVINNIIKHKKNNLYFQTSYIPKYVYILILFALLCSGGLLEHQMVAIDEYTILQGAINRIFTVISIVLLIIIIISLVFICALKSQLENTALLLEKLNLSQAEYYQTMIKLNEELRKFKHDYKNHNTCLRVLLEKQQYDDALQYVREITYNKIIESDKFFTGNQIGDAILSAKSADANKINAEIKFDGSICDKLPLSDVCVILANALDNAIEACEKITDSDKKIIRVKCAFSQNVQIIQIANPVEKDVQIHNNSVETTKDDKSSHGIGLHNIMRTVDKYNGEFSISCENKQFVLDIGFQVCNAEDNQLVIG